MKASRPVRMKEIDELRALVTEYQARIHQCVNGRHPLTSLGVTSFFRDPGYLTGACLACARERREIDEVLRPQIETLLFAWWKQGCKEVKEIARYGILMAESPRVQADPLEGWHDGFELVDAIRKALIRFETGGESITITRKEFDQLQIAKAYYLEHHSTGEPR